MNLHSYRPYQSMRNGVRMLHMRLLNAEPVVGGGGRKSLFLEKF